MNYKDLFEGCKKGDPKAQRVLYDLFCSQLMGLCRRYARDRDHAQDMLQESFIKIFKSIHQVESIDKLEGWLKTVAIRTAIDHYHKVKNHHLFFARIENEEDAGDPGYDPGDNVSDEYLLSLVNSLPDGCRVIFNLFAIEGYNHAEIASMLNVSEGTSRSQFHYARHLLKARLKCINLNHYYEKFA